MGSAGIAIGPDGKPIKKQDKQMSRGHRGGKKVREQRGAAGMPIGGRPFRPGGMGVGGPMRGPRMMVGHGNSAIMRVPGPVGPGMGIAPLMSALRGSPNGPGNGPRGVNDNFGFFRDVNPQRPVGLSISLVCIKQQYKRFGTFVECIGYLNVQFTSLAA
uniref:SMARCD3 n=1 Tax=Heterorhabditis bacteriophora TaxID=37862 RepID=A0A1I7XMQ8_HETBA